MQTIGFLSHLRSKGVHGPFMVVGPLSTLPNWVSEFARWCPSMPCILYHGNKAERQALRSKRMPSGAPHPPSPVLYQTSLIRCVANCDVMLTLGVVIKRRR